MSDKQPKSDFSEFAEAANHSGRPRDLPFESAYNNPPDDAFLDILYKKIQLNKNNAPTKRGWKTLYNLLSLYRSKQYETFRYLLLDKTGEIVDHVAITNYVPDRVLNSPHFMSPKDYYAELALYVFKNDCKIIVAHNHPSGNVKPSEVDMQFTTFLLKAFGDRFAGHIILDHGSFGLCFQEKLWESVSLKSSAHDPLIKQNRNAFFDYNWNDGFTSDRVTLMRCALKIDNGSEWNSRDWVAVAFASASGKTNALHYYHTSEFKKKKAADFIRKKTVAIAKRSGAIWAFAFTENDSMLKPLTNITKKTAVFKDFYVNGVVGNTLGLGGEASEDLLYISEVDSTIYFSNMKEQPSPAQEQKDKALDEATITNNVSDNKNHFYEGKKNMTDNAKGKENALTQEKSALSWRPSEPPLFFSDFYKNPYAKGSIVPDFFLQEANGLKAYSGFSFKRMNNDQKSLVLARKTPGGKEENVAIPSKLYQTMIDNAGTFLKKPEPTPEVLHSYDKMIAKDAEEARSNRAVNFWHNYKVLCRQQASNPQKAMEVAKAIVRQMPVAEQKKLKRAMKIWEKKTRKLVANPLLRPFVKPQETYNQRILNYYEENVRDLPIKNVGAHGQDALGVIRRGAASRDVPGQAIDPALRLKIGGTVKLSLDCKTLFGENRKRLPIAEYTVVAASEDLNKIVLLDKTGNSKYTLARDAFCEKMAKLEKKLEKRRLKQDRHESIRY
jgi:proteasome lid subunit RPN8/RPN11